MVDTVSNNGIRSLQELQAAKAPSKDNAMGQDVFMKLMVTQMQNQNPLDPQDGSEFVAQLAQFSSVEALDKLNKTTETMASTFQSGQALQASSMVGRTVKVEGNHANFETGRVVKGTVSLESSTSNLQMNVYNAAGELVDKKDMGDKAAGDITFEWDGKVDGGKTLPPGRYRFEVLAGTGDGKNKSVDLALSANVNSVTIGQGGRLTLNIEGVGPTSLTQVKEIM